MAKPFSNHYRHYNNISCRLSLPWPTQKSWQSHSVSITDITTILVTDSRYHIVRGVTQKSWQSHLVRITGITTILITVLSHFFYHKTYSEQYAAVYGYWVTMEIVSQMWMPSLSDPTSAGAMSLIRHLQSVVSSYLRGVGHI